MDHRGRRKHISGVKVGKYLLGRAVGEGISSEVRLATDTSNGKLVALKIIQKEWIYQNEVGALVQREIDIVRELDHPCLVKLIEVFNSADDVFMVMEAVDGSDLHEELRQRGRMEEARARGLFQQLMTAVQYLHSIGVAHRDIKLENVLLSKDGARVYLADLGLAARLDEWEDSGDGAQGKKGRLSFRWSSNRRGSQGHQSLSCGTPSYAAPEIIASSDKHRYDARGVDTWSAGVCLYAMATGTLPFGAGSGSLLDTLNAVQTAEPVFPEHLSSPLVDLLRGMLRKDPAKRMTVAAVLSNPWTTTRTPAVAPGRGAAAAGAGADADKAAGLPARSSASASHQIAWLRAAAPPGRPHRSSSDALDIVAPPDRQHRSTSDAAISTVAPPERQHRSTSDAISSVAPPGRQYRRSASDAISTVAPPERQHRSTSDAMSSVAPPGRQYRRSASDAICTVAPPERQHHSSSDTIDSGVVPPCRQLSSLSSALRSVARPGRQLRSLSEALGSSAPPAGSSLASPTSSAP